MISVTNLGDFVPVIIALVGTGGILGGIVAILKVRPESGQIAVTASQGALVVQTGVIENLKKEIDRANAKVEWMLNRMEALEAEAAKVDQLHARVAQVEEDNKRLRNERDKLRKRVVHLEREVERLNGDLNGDGMV